MTVSMDRRKFLAGSVAGAAALRAVKKASLAAAPSDAGAGGGLKKAVVIGMLGGQGSVEDRFKTARDLGFDGVEANTIDDPKQVEAMRAAAEKTGIRVHSIMNSGHWKYPLSSGDPDVVKNCVAGIKTSMQNAKDLGADTVLLVPAVVSETTRYAEAYERSQKEIRALLALAEDLGVILAIENVWNKFLLSPIEFAQYVDSFQSPFVRAYFDCGNILLYGYPQDWIRTLGKRIVKIHVKDFKRDGYAWKNLRDGDVDWPEVRRALDEVGYRGWITAEIGGGDEAYLRDVSARMDLILAGK